MITNETRTAMRSHTVGPCTETDKQTIKEGLVRLGEPLEPPTLWNHNPKKFDSIRYFNSPHGDWGTSKEEPNISAKQFIETFL
jgi:hypothetical protein